MTGACLCLLLLGGDAAHAGAPDEDVTAKIEAKAEEAARHFGAKDYAKAVRAYIEAYQIAQRPSELLYNIAFIYDEKLKEYEMAAIYYKRYAATVDGDPALVEKAVVRIGQLRKMANAPSKKPEEKKPEEKKPNVGPSPNPGAAAKSSGLETGGIASLVVGGLLMATGGGLYIGAMLANDDFQVAQNQADRTALANDGRTFALAGDVAMGVGAAAALVGVILIAVAPSDEGRSSVNVGATWLPGGGAAFTLGGQL